MFTFVTWAAAAAGLARTAGVGWRRGCHGQRAWGGGGAATDSGRGVATGLTRTAGGRRPPLAVFPPALPALPRTSRRPRRSAPAPSPAHAVRWGGARCGGVGGFLPCSHPPPCAHSTRSRSPPHMATPRPYCRPALPAHPCHPSPRTNGKGRPPPARYPRQRPAATPRPLPVPTSRRRRRPCYKCKHPRTHPCYRCK